jgi:hypothetical protein
MGAPVEEESQLACIIQAMETSRAGEVVTTQHGTVAPLLLYLQTVKATVIQAHFRRYLHRRVLSEARMQRDQLARGEVQLKMKFADQNSDKKLLVFVALPCSADLTVRWNLFVLVTSVLSFCVQKESSRVKGVLKQSGL